MFDPKTLEVVFVHIDFPTNCQTALYFNGDLVIAGNQFRTNIVSRATGWLDCLVAQGWYGDYLSYHFRDKENVPMWGLKRLPDSLTDVDLDAATILKYNHQAKLDEWYQTRTDAYRKDFARGEYTENYPR